MLDQMMANSTQQPRGAVKKNVGEDILKKMGWKGKGHGMAQT